MKNIEVVAAVIRRNKEIFATQRGYGDYKGKWEFPGGKVEPGERPEAALSREIKEELNASIDIERFLCTVEYDYPEFHLTMHCYLSTLVKDSYELIEHSAAKWVGAQTIDGLDWLGADIEVIETLKNQGVI